METDVRLNENKECLLCNFDDFSHQLVYANQYFNVILPRKPIGNGYFIVFPKRHTNTFDLSEEEYLAFSECINKVNSIFKKHFNSDDFNLFCNIGKSAGQHIPHIHFHIFNRSTDEKYNPLDKLNKKDLADIEDLNRNQIIEIVLTYKNTP